MSVFIIIRSSRLLFARYRHISFVQTASSPARHERTHDGLRLCQLKPQRVATCTNRITVCGIEVVIVDSANPVLIALGGVVQRLQHQILRRVGEQVSVLLESNDQCCTNKTTPVRVPRVVDVRGINRGTNVWLLWIFLVVTVPGFRQTNKKVYRIR